MTRKKAKADTEADLQAEIRSLQIELKHAQQEKQKYREMYLDEHNKLLGALLSIQAITKSGEPRLFKAG